MCMQFTVFMSVELYCFRSEFLLIQG